MMEISKTFPAFFLLLCFFLTETSYDTMTAYFWHDLRPVRSLLRCRMLEVPSLQLTLSVTVPGLLRQTRSEVSPSVERAEY